jgi:hypothetical protein
MVSAKMSPDRVDRYSGHAGAHEDSIRELASDRAGSGGSGRVPIAYRKTYDPGKGGTMKRLIAMAIVVLLASPAAFAKGQGKGKGKDKPEDSPGTTVERTVEDAAGEISDAVEHEFRHQTGHPEGGGGPPGLAKKDKVPPGLEKKGKTPEGWTEGEKTGWEHESEVHEERGFFGRTFDRIFGRSGGGDRDDKREKKDEPNDD